MQLDIEGQGAKIFGKIPRANAIQYDSLGHDDYVDEQLHIIFTSS